jgi:predicted CopG family antitoxin
MLGKRINIGLRYDVYTKLKDKGRFGESFSELVSRIIDESNNVSLESESLEGLNHNT